MAGTAIDSTPYQLEKERSSKMHISKVPQANKTTSVRAPAFPKYFQLYTVFQAIFSGFFLNALYALYLISQPAKGGRLAEPGCGTARRHVEPRTWSDRAALRAVFNFIQRTALQCSRLSSSPRTMSCRSTATGPWHYWIWTASLCFQKASFPVRRNFLVAAIVSKIVFICLKNCLLFFQRLSWNWLESRKVKRHIQTIQLD